MVDNNRGSNPLGRGHDDSVLDSSGTQADAVLLFDLVHSPLHPTWSSQNYLWQCGWGGKWKNLYNRDSCEKKCNLCDSQLGADDKKDAKSEGTSWGLWLHFPHSLKAALACCLDPALYST